MADIEGLSSEELKQLIVDSLRDVGVDPELIEITVRKGQRVVLRGSVGSAGERDLIIQTVVDATGAEGMIDEIFVLEEDYSGQEDDVLSDDDRGLLDEDNEYYGTDDVFRSVEDGMPYIPPMSGHFEEVSAEEERRRRARRRRNSG